MGGGGASESRRIAPRRVVRLGYQMVRTSSRCTVRLYHHARGTSRECNGGIRAVSYAAVAARLRTTLVSPNYLVRLVRSGDRKWTARPENIDPPRVLKRRVTRPEWGQANGGEGKMKIHLVDMIGLVVRQVGEKKNGRIWVFVQSQKQWVPIERILRRYVRRRRRTHGVLIIVVVRKRGTTMVREISGAQEMLTPGVVHRTPNRVDYGEKQRKREFTGVNEQRKKKEDNTRGVSISSTEFVRGEKNFYDAPSATIRTIERNEDRSATLVMISGLRVKGTRPKLMPELTKSQCQIKKINILWTRKKIFLSDDRC